MASSSSSSTAKPMQALHSRSVLPNVVTLLLLFSFGFVLGMVCNANFHESYLPPFLQPLPSLLRSSSTPPPPAPSPASPSPLSTPETACVGPPLPSPPTQQPTPPPSSPALMGFADFLAPSGGGLMHNMTDEELLWRASMVPMVARVPWRIVPKVAFLFLVRGELPLRPLWEKFFAGHEGLYSIYVHASPSYAGSPPADSVFHGRMIPSQNTSWGDMNLVYAERRLLATALLDLSNARFALLSEACIPLVSFPAAYAFLTAGANTSFVESYATRARHAPFFAERNVSLAQWRKGSQWFEVDRAIAVEVVAEERFMAVFRGDHGIGNMEEHYLPTLVSLLRWGARNANRTLTYADWRIRGPHPVSHGARAVSAGLLEGMRRGAGNCGFGGGGGGGAVEFCFMFARKFSGDALEKLLELAPKVMGFG